MSNEQTIANLVIKLSADVASLGPGLKKAETDIKSFAGSMGTIIAPAVAKLAAGLTAILGSAGFVSAISGAREFAAEMSRTAEKIGVPIELLSVLADAADKAGVSTQSLAQGLKFLSRNMFEASQGTGAAKAIFDELGVSFKNADGTLRPVQDVLLDLVGKFSAMEDGAGKTAIALKFFGRAGQDMVPFMNLGTDSIKEFIVSAQKMGLQIDSGMGMKARALGNTFKEIGDAIKGLAIGIMSALLPSTQNAASGVQTLAEKINGLRFRLTEIGEALRYVAAIALPLLVVQLGSMVSSVGLANIAMKVFGATLTFFTGPVGLISAALAGLAVGWVYLGKETREAARAHEEFIVAAGKLDPAALQKNAVLLTDYINMIQQKIAEARKAIDESGPSLAQGMALDTLLKYEAEAKARIAAVQKLQEAVNKPAKVAAPIVTDPEVLKKLQDKTAQLGAEFMAFQDPVKGASAAIEEFIRQTIGTVPQTEKLKAAAQGVRAAFQILFKAQQERANVAAIEKNTFDVSVAGWESYGQDLQRQFENGLIDIRSYYNERKNLIVAQTRAEILALEAEKGKTETTPARKIEIEGMVTVKGVKLDSSIKKEIADETAAWRTLGETSLDFEQRMAEAQGRVLDAKRKALQLEMQTYEVGLRSKGASAEDAKKQADALLASKTKEIGFNEQIRQFNLEMADLGIRKQKIQDDLAIGVGDQFTAEQSTMELERQRVPILQAMAAAATQLALASADPALLQQAQALDAAIRQLGISVDESGRRLAEFKKGAQDALINGFANFLSRGIFEAKNFGEAVKNMAKNFAQAMLDMVAQMIATMAVKAMFNAIMGIAGLSGGGEASAGADGNFGAGPPMASGGPVRRAPGGAVRGPGTGTSDSILARLSNGEYVIPKGSVDYYGLNIFEAIRKMILPKEMFTGFGRFAVARPQFAFAEGGLATGSFAPQGENKLVTLVNEWHINTLDARGFRELLVNERQTIEAMQIESMRGAGVMRDAVRRYR